MSERKIEKIPVVILCGGKGMRLAGHADAIPKALIEVGGRPILWHVMKLYAHFGFKDFILCLGHLGHAIKEFFTERLWQVGDFTLQLAHIRELTMVRSDAEDWQITFADTGVETNTGGRIKRIEKYVASDVFFATYVDGLADLDLNKLLSFHLSHGKIATLTAVNPTSPFGILELGEDGRIKTFQEKPKLNQWINGGFFVFDRRIFDQLGEDDDLERDTFVRLAASGQLMAYKHTSYWVCMDTYKDTVLLNQLWDSGKAPWKVWG